MLNLEIIQQCQKSCHLFEFFKQQSNILRCFCSLKFEKSLFSDKFFSFISHSNMTVLIAEKGYILS